MNIHILTQSDQILHLKFRPCGLWFQIVFSIFLIEMGFYSISILSHSTPWPICWILGLTCLTGGAVILFYLREIDLQGDRAQDQMDVVRQQLLFKHKKTTTRLKLSEIIETNLKILTVRGKSGQVYSFDVGLVTKDRKTTYLAKGALFTENSAKQTQELLNQWLHLT